MPQRRLLPQRRGLPRLEELPEQEQGELGSLWCEWRYEGGNGRWNDGAPFDFVHHAREVGLNPPDSTGNNEATSRDIDIWAGCEQVEAHTGTLRALRARVPPLFQVTPEPIQPNDDGQVWLALRIENPTNRPAVRCTATLSQYGVERYLGEGDIVVPPPGHLFAWSTRDGNGVAQNVGAMGTAEEAKVLDLFFAAGDAEREFYHSGEQPRPGYVGIYPVGMGDYRAVIDVHTDSDGVGSTRVIIRFGFMGGRALHFNGDIIVQRVPD
jgi:hypothetical protein